MSRGDEPQQDSADVPDRPVRPPGDGEAPGQPSAASAAPAAEDAEHAEESEDADDSADDLAFWYDATPGYAEESASGRARHAGHVAVLDRPSRSDAVVAAASGLLGGPAGDRMAMGRRRFGPGGGLIWVTVMLSLLSVVTLGFGVLEKQHCRTYGWNSPNQFWHACYSDIPVLYGSAGLGAKDAPTLVAAVAPDGLGQPPLASATMWVMSRLVDGTDPHAARVYFDLSAVLLAGALAVAVAAVVLAAGRRPWDAAHVAAAPVLVTAGLLSYDLLAVAFLAIALLAWSRHRSVLGGALLGLAIATRPVTAVVLVAIGVLAVRTGRAKPLLGLGLTAGAVWLGVRLVLLPGSAGGFPDALSSWRSGGPGYGSLWLVPSLISQSKPDKLRFWSQIAPFWYHGAGLSSTTTSVAVVVCLAAVGLTTAFLGLAMLDRPRLAHLALFAVAGSVLVAKSVPVQAPLVLLPLIALAGLRWRDHLIWATTELVYFVGVWLYIGASSDPNKGLPPTFYLLLLLARAVGIVWVMVQAVRAMRDPLLDPVRVPPDGTMGTDDPQGGEFSGCPDALVIRMV
jgi:hypothetical protein